MTKILFMGTPDFAVPCLEILHKSGHEIVGVVAQPDRPKSRGLKLIAPPVKEYAVSNNLKVLQPEKLRNNKEVIDEIKALQPDIIVVVAFGQILPQEVLDIPKYGCINVHGSLLPKYRGAAPIQWSVINGDTTTGITTMYMDKGLDTGDMILKKEIEILANETAGELHDRLSIIGAELLKDTVEKILKNEAPREKQPAEFTYAPMLTKEMGNIDWNMEAIKIYDLIRGLSPWPGAYTSLNGETFKVCKITYRIETHNNKPGTIVKADSKTGFDIACSDGVICILELHPQNGKRMSFGDYLRGHKVSMGDFVNRKC